MCILNVAAILYAVINRSNFYNSTSETESKHLYMHVLLIKVSRKEVLSGFLYLTCAFPFLHGGDLENHPKWRFRTVVK